MEWIADFPRDWPKPWRRAFVVLFPVAVPLWLAGWFAVAVLTICMALAFLAAAGVSLFPALLWATWKGARVEGPIEVVTNFWSATFVGLVRLFTRKA